MKEGSAIVNSTSVNAFKGNATLLDYTATKGAIIAFTRGLALQLVKRGIRVNGNFAHLILIQGSLFFIFFEKTWSHLLLFRVSFPLLQDSLKFADKPFS